MPVAPGMTTIGTLVDGSPIVDLHLYIWIVCHADRFTADPIGDGRMNAPTASI